MTVHVKTKSTSLYRASEWYKFAEKIKKRDNYSCLKCGRKSPDVVLQVHHEVYKEDRKPWEYNSSDCITLCSGCHAREHNLIVPIAGWTLLCINDLGDLSGNCEKKGCNNSIRYEHVTYHPQWGYQIVGSTCVEHLTKKDIELSKDALSCYKKIRTFLASHTWHSSIDIEGVQCVKTKHYQKHIFIYPVPGGYKFIVRHNNGIAMHKPIQKLGISLDQAKELSSITLFGIEAKHSKKEVFRNLYKNVCSL